MANESGLSSVQVKRVLLAGATGYIGRQVLEELKRQGCQVTAIVRNADGHVDTGDVVVSDMRKQEVIIQQLADRTFDAVISCIASRTGVPEDAWAVDYGINANLLTAGLRGGAQKFVLLSAICVQRPKLAFQHAKLKFEQQLIDSGMDFSIVRPTAYFKSLAGQIARVQSGKPFLLFGNGRLTACKPISRRDLARYLVDSLGDESRKNRILPIGGPGEAITPREQGDFLFELTGRAPRFRHVSPRLLAHAARWSRPLGNWIPAIAVKSELARIGHYYATESMLLWDEAQQRYDAASTPSTGTDTLWDFYERAINDGLDGHEAGAHKLFID